MSGALACTDGVRASTRRKAPLSASRLRARRTTCPMDRRMAERLEAALRNRIRGLERRPRGHPTPSLRRTRTLRQSSRTVQGWRTLRTRHICNLRARFVGRDFRKGGAMNAASGCRLLRAVVLPSCRASSCRVRLPKRRHSIPAYGRFAVAVDSGGGAGDAVGARRPSTA